MADEDEGSHSSEESEFSYEAFLRLLSKHYSEDAIKRLEPYFVRMNEAFHRTLGLVIAASRVEERDTREDIFRAVLVLNHAYLEDVLRTLAIEFLPRDENTLNGIPLVGTGRTEKFFLGKLAKYKGKLVDEVLEDSIAEYLAHSSFNSVSDITKLLEAVSVKVSDENFSDLDQMVRRRHQIVHQGDFVKLSDNTYRLQHVSLDELQRWFRATNGLIHNIMRSLEGRLHRSKAFAGTYDRTTQPPILPR